MQTFSDGKRLTFDCRKIIFMSIKKLIMFYFYTVPFCRTFYFYPIIIKSYILIRIRA